MEQRKFPNKFLFRKPICALLPRYKVAVLKSQESEPLNLSITDVKEILENEQI